MTETLGLVPVLGGLAIGVFSGVVAGASSGLLGIGGGPAVTALLMVCRAAGSG